MSICKAPPPAPLTVSANRHEIMFRDGSSVGLQPVLRDGHPELFLRVLAGKAHLPVLLDLRHLAPSLAEDLPPAHDRDRPGLVFYTLRGKYRSAPAFTAAALDAGQPLAQAPVAHAAEACA